MWSRASFSSDEKLHEESEARVDVTDVTWGWRTVLNSIESAKVDLELYSDNSHEAAMAMDRLNEAMFWATHAAMRGGE